MKLKVRRLEESDWNTLKSWWEKWPEWTVPAKDSLPDNGTGGFIVESNNEPVVAGFVYLSNSKTVFLEWIISNPEYRDNDRKTTIELLITAIEFVVKDQGYKYVITLGRNKSLVETHKKLGYHVDDLKSHEMVKIL